MHWKKNPIYIIDCEGTYRSGVLEYGIVILEDGEVVEVKTRFCNAENGILDEEFLLHGINEGDTKGNAPFSEDWDYFNKIRKQGPFGAHHASVENKFLKIEWPYPSKSPNFLCPGESVIDWGPWLDTYQLYKRIFPDLKSYKLADLIETFDLQEELDVCASKYCREDRGRYHCALYDALASALLVQYLGKIEEFESMSLEWLLENSSSSASGGRDIRQKTLF